MMVATLGYLRVRLCFRRLVAVYLHRQQILTEPADGLDEEVGGHRQNDNEKNSQHRVDLG